MNDDKSLLFQVYELQVIVNKLKVVKIDIPEVFQVGAIVAKLPPTWSNYRKRLLYNYEDLSLEQIQKHLRIKEESRVREKMANVNLNTGSSKANVVSDSKSNKKRWK